MDGAAGQGGLARRGRAAAALLLALNLLAPAPLLFLKVDNAPEVYFPPDAPAVRFEQALRERFPQDEVLVVLLRPPAGEPPRALFATPTLRALDRAVQRIAAHPLVDRVFAVTTLEHIAGAEGGFTVERLVSPDDGADPAARRRRALADRFAPGFVVSRDADTLALIVRPHDLEDTDGRVAVLEVARAALDAEGLAPWVAGYAGEVALAVAQLRSMLRDTLTFVPLTTALGLGLVAWLFRRGLAVALSALAIGAVVAGTIAVLVAWGRPYTMVSAMIPPLLTALTVALLIHLFNAVRLADRRGHRGEARVRRALEEIRRPARYTALTTAAGLGSLALSPVPPIATFGVAAGIGVLLAYPVVVGLVAATLARYDRRRWPAAAGAVWIDRLVARAARLGMRRAGAVAAASALAVAVGLPLALSVRAETDLYRFFGPEHPLTRATRLAESELSGVATLEVYLEAPERDAFEAPARLAALRGLQRWLEAQPEVDRTVSAGELVEEMNWAFHGEDPVWRRVPDSRRLVAQYLFIYDGQDLWEVLDRDLQRARVPMNLGVHGANAIAAFIARLERHLQAALPEDLRWRVAGLGRLFADQEDLLVTGQLRSLAGALALVFALMLLLWRSLRAAALCMLPNLAPVLLIFALMGALGVWLDMASAMIASVAIGIAVDDTIHVYEGYRRRRAAGQGAVVALARTYAQAGRAITLTTVVLGSQFLLLGASAFVPTVEFGLLSAAGLLAALVFDLLLLPALVVLAARRRARGGAEGV